MYIETDVIILIGNVMVYLRHCLAADMDICCSADFDIYVCFCNCLVSWSYGPL